VVVSQVHRSGGTLLQRLLDAHGQLHVIPHELGPLIPDRPLPLDPAEAWALLHDPKLPRRFRRGLRQQEKALNNDRSKTGFLLPPVVHRRIYEELLQPGGPWTERALFDTYLTSYFNGWLDYRGLRDADKRWVVGFEPLLIDQPKRVETVWRAYPDGRLITILRDPASWFVSARRWSPRFERLEPALALWRSAALAAERQLGDERVLGLLFEELVTEPEATMRRVASFLDIEFDDVLLRPTANGVAFGANSSFETPPPGSISAEAADRRAHLTAEELATIERETGEVYDRLLRRVGGQLPSAS
jgi:hypothetical protein